MPICKMLRSILLLSLLSAIPCYADFLFTESQGAPVKSEPSPWFTGPLLAPSAHTIPQGHVNLEPYFFYTVNTGIYTKHWHAKSIPNFYNSSLQFLTQVGITKFMDFQVIPEIVWNKVKNQSYLDIGDLPFVVGFQLALDVVGGWQPAVKLRLGANIPTGKYDHLKASKLGSDSTGSGSWLPTVGLVFSKLLQLGTGIHFLDARLFVNYQIGTPAYVKGLCTYGGGKGTHGKVLPGNTLTVDGAIECNLTKRWGIALDGVYVHNNKTRFSGKTTRPIGPPSGEQFSLAPAVQYNWSEDIGVIGGVWFTVAGRNAARFTSGVIAINIYI
ncbi:MAG: transporter [Chlamydiae bacterium]|nr:transporter [Chlamydiota bacterium]